MAQPGITYTPTATARQWISHSAIFLFFFKEKKYGTAFSGLDEASF